MEARNAKGVAYIAEMSSELAEIARADDHIFLACLLEMAALEAAGKGEVNRASCCEVEPR